MSVSALQSFTFISQLWTSQALVSILNTQTVWGLRWCNLSPTSFICLPVLFICLPVLFIFGLPGWVLVVGFPAGLFRISFHLSPTSFHLSPFLSFVSQARCLWLGSRPACLPLPFPLLFICLPVLFIVSQAGCLWSRVCGWLVSHFLSCVSHFLSFVSHFFSFVSHFLSFVSQAGCLWSGFRLACLPLPFICLPLLFICLPGCLWSGLRLACLPRAFICLPLLSFVFQFFSFVSHFFSFPKQFTVRGSQCFKEWSPWCWMVWSGSLVSQAGCLWSGSGPACLPLPFICLALLFICLPGWVLVVGFPASLSPTSFHLSPTSFLLVVGFPAGLSPTSSYLSPTSFHLSPTSFHLSPRLGACGRVPALHLLSFVSRFFSFISQKCFICLPGPSLLVPCSISIHLSLSLLISALFRWPRSISIHLSPRLVTGGVRPFPLFLFICLPGLSLLVSALFRWPCSISIHLSPRSVTASVLSPRSVTAGVRTFRRPCSISIH